MFRKHKNSPNLSDNNRLQAIYLSSYHVTVKVIHHPLHWRYVLWRFVVQNLKEIHRPNGTGASRACLYFIASKSLQLSDGKSVRDIKNDSTKAITTARVQENILVVELVALLQIMLIAKWCRIDQNAETGKKHEKCCSQKARIGFWKS